MKQDFVLAIDIGASSGRHILGTKQGDAWELTEVYRFPNGMVERNGHFCWDMDALFGHILSGLRECKNLGKIPKSVGIDTWGVDFALLDGQGKLLGDCVAYRDDRTQGMDAILEADMPLEALYARTGIAKQPYNSIYQLMAVLHEQPEQLEKAETLLFMPCYLGYLLTGQKRNEYTIASTSGLLNAQTRAWDAEVIQAAGLPERLFQEAPAAPGTLLGTLRQELVQELGFDTQVLLTGCHDTASAFMSIEPKEADAVYLSSGTWSLLGVELDAPITSPASMEAGFTNEGGYGGKIRYLQNIMGMWILQEIRRELGKAHSYGDMAKMAERGAAYTALFDPTDDRFMVPKSMSKEIKAALGEAGEKEPESLEELLCCVNKSLAACYARAIRRLESLTGQRFGSVRIFGGGCQNEVLNRWTEEATGLAVIAGPVEATAMGNLMIQWKALGLA